MDETSPPAFQSRDSIEDIWGSRTPYDQEWPERVDYALDQQPDRWVQSACVLCRWVAKLNRRCWDLIAFNSNGCGLDIGVKDGKVVGVRGRASDCVNKGRLGPKGLHG